MELPISRQNALIPRTPNCGEHVAWRTMPSQIATFRRSATQCLYGIVALTLVTFVCFQLKTDLATTAFIYLAVIVLLSLIGSYVVSVVFTTILSDAAANRRREMAPRPGLAAAANSSRMAPELIGAWAVSWRRV
jgi:multidrug efflux pump subunit AcrB